MKRNLVVFKHYWTEGHHTIFIGQAINTLHGYQVEGRYSRGELDVRWIPRHTLDGEGEVLSEDRDYECC